MPELETPLDAAPSPEAWWAIVAWLAQSRAAGALGGAVKEAKARVAGWPESVPRVCPLAWLRRLADGEEVAEASLVNTLELGNALALAPGGFDDFFTLDPAELGAILEAPFGPITTLSYSDEVGCHPLHPGFVVEMEDAQTLLRRPWPALKWFRLSGWGLTETLLPWIEAAAGMTSLRRLSLGQGGWEVDEDALRRVLASPLLGRTTHLELVGYDGLMTPPLARQIVAAPSIRGLTEIHLGEMSRECAVIFGTLAQDGVRVEVDVVD